MPVTLSEAQWPAYRRAARTVVVVDVVESVRLMEQNEEDTVHRWQAFVGEVVTRLMPPHGGRLVKSLGDGLMLEFEAVPPAIQCAIAMQTAISQANQGRPAEQWMCLRVGAHVADVIVDEHDIYGSGVNLASRLTTLAGPGEIVVSADVRDRLVPGLDAEVEDLGPCYLKHLAQPVQAYRVRAGWRQISTAQPPVMRSAVPGMPTVAVIPFEGRAVSAPHDVIGDVIADSVIARLSSSEALRVISRLSTSVLRSRAHSAAQVGALLGATFVVNGSYRLAGDRVVLLVEMADSRNQEVVWAEECSERVDDILQPESAMAVSLSQRIMAAICATELRRVQTMPLPTLEGCALQLAATTLLHRSSRSEFARARDVLEHLVERFPNTPIPRAWLAAWYVLRVTRGLVENHEAESGRALEQTRRALDAAPDCSLALAMEGFVYCHMIGDLAAADERLDRALRVNPNEPFAWLVRGVVQGFRNEGEAAYASSERAIELSPLDPIRHYYNGLAASAAVAAGKLPRAIELAQASLQVNRNHLPTLRGLAIAQVESGAIGEARLTVARILALEPGFTLRDYVARAPRGAEATRQRYSRALSEAGVPFS